MIQKAVTNLFTDTTNGGMFVGRENVDGFRAILKLLCGLSITEGHEELKDVIYGYLNRITHPARDMSELVVSVINHIDKEKERSELQSEDDELKKGEARAERERFEKEHADLSAQRIEIEERKNLLDRLDERHKEEAGRLSEYEKGLLKVDLNLRVREENLDQIKKTLAEREKALDALGAETNRRADLLRMRGIRLPEPKPAKKSGRSKARPHSPRSHRS